MCQNAQTYICNECQICVALWYAESKRLLSHCGLSSDMTVHYTLENVWAWWQQDSLVNFRESQSLKIRLYITQHLTRLPAVTCPYCWRNCTCGGDKDFNIGKLLQCFWSSSGSNLYRVSRADCIQNCTFPTFPRRVEHLRLN